MANADTLEGAGVNSGNALDAAKLQNNSETTKDKEAVLYFTCIKICRKVGIKTPQITKWLDCRFRISIGSVA